MDLGRELQSYADRNARLLTLVFLMVTLLGVGMMITGDLKSHWRFVILAAPVLFVASLFSVSKVVVGEHGVRGKAIVRTVDLPWSEIYKVVVVPQGPVMVLAPGRRLVVGVQHGVDKCREIGELVIERAQLHAERSPNGKIVGTRGQR